MPPGSFFWDLPWYLPHGLMLVSARSATWRAPSDRDAHPSAISPRPARRGRPLVLYAAALPIVHLVISFTGMLPEATLRARELCVIAVVAVLSVLAVLYQRALERENGRLEREHRSIDKQLQIAQRMEAVGRLAGGMAHDFNNNLQVIQACVEMQLDDLPEHDPARENLHEITAASGRAASLATQLLNVVRRKPCEPEPFALDELIGDMGPMLQRVLGETVRLCIELDESSCCVLADRGEIEQVILNLAINARDAMPSGGELTLRTRALSAEGSRDTEDPEGELALVTLRDTGIGMDEYTRARVFEPFFTTKATEGGTGLGLSVAAGIIRRAGGRMSVQTELGRGSEFRIALPATDQGRRGADPQETRPDATTGSPDAERVLVVEDEEAVRVATTQLLRALGYETLVAESGEEALRVLELQPQPIDLLLTDVVMTGMQGDVLARTVLERSPRTAVLFMTGYGAEVLRGSSLLAGRDAILHKPFRRADLAHKVRASLDAR